MSEAQQDSVIGPRNTSYKAGVIYSMWRNILAHFSDLETELVDINQQYRSLIAVKTGQRAVREATRQENRELHQNEKDLVFNEAAQPYMHLSEARGENPIHRSSLRLSHQDQSRKHYNLGLIIDTSYHSSEDIRYYVMRNIERLQEEINKRQDNDTFTIKITPILSNGADGSPVLLDSFSVHDDEKADELASEVVKFMHQSANSREAEHPPFQLQESLEALYTTQADAETADKLDSIAVIGSTEVSRSDKLADKGRQFGDLGIPIANMLYGLEGTEKSVKHAFNAMSRDSHFTRYSVRGWLNKKWNLNSGNLTLSHDARIFLDYERATGAALGGGLKIPRPIGFLIAAGLSLPLAFCDPNRDYNPSSEELGPSVNTAEPSRISPLTPPEDRDIALSNEDFFPRITIASEPIPYVSQKPKIFDLDQGVGLALFEQGEHELSPESQRKLITFLAEAIAQKGFNFDLFITGNASIEGNAQANQALSTQRAIRVNTFLEYVVRSYNNNPESPVARTLSAMLRRVGINKDNQERLEILSSLRGCGVENAASQIEAGDRNTQLSATSPDPVNDNCEQAFSSKYGFYGYNKDLFEWDPAWGNLEYISPTSP